MVRLLALAILVLPVAPADAQVRDSLLWLQARVQFDGIVSDQPAEATAAWKASANAPSARTIAFGRAGRYSPAVELRLRDSLYVGTGRVPPPSEIRAIRVRLETGMLTVSAPAGGWGREKALTRVVFEPNDEPVVSGEAQVWTDLRPDGAAFNIGMPPTLGVTIGMPPSRR
jgi:hypothetical protein